MFIRISNTNGRYFFEIYDSYIDAPSASFSSIRDGFLVPSMPRTFSTFVEAQHYAKELVKKNPTIVYAKKLGFYRNAKATEIGIDELDISMNDQILSNYGDQLSLMEKHLDNVIDNIESEEYGDEEKDKIVESFAQEAQKIVGGIKEVIEENDFSKDEKKQMDQIKHDLEDLIKKTLKYSPNKAIQEEQSIPVPPDQPVQPDQAAMPGMPPPESPPPMPQPLAQSCKESVLTAFGEAAALSISNNHPTAHIGRIERDARSNSYLIYLADCDGDVVGLRVGENMLVDGIFPIRNDNKVYSSDFLNLYWKPIVYSVGHVVDGESVLVPNYVMSAKEIHGFNKKGSVKSSICIKDDDKSLGIKKSWWIKTSQQEKKISEFSEDELVGAEVMCIDKSKEIYYGHTGEVKSIIPRDDYIDVKIDFRRGLGELMLKDDQIKIVNLHT